LNQVKFELFIAKIIIIIKVITKIIREYLLLKITIIIHLKLILNFIPLQ